MLININSIKWYDRIWAALIFFTRLPFWRIHQPPKQAYETVVEHWPMTGWLTGGIMALTLWIGSYISISFGVIVAIIVRIILTGALHEDGLADFFDGFGGGGNNREQILKIMKDSHIGTYGVLGLILYILVLYTTLTSMPNPMIAALTIWIADPFCKMIAGQIIQMMPYARSAEEAKNKVVYRTISIQAGISLFIQGMLPTALVYLCTFASIHHPLFSMSSYVLQYNSYIVTCIVMYFLYLLLAKRLRGYTGDCCGAIFLLTELSFYITALISYSNYDLNMLMIWK